MNKQKIEVGTVTNYSVKGGFDAFGLSNVLDTGSSRGVSGWNYNQKAFEQFKPMAARYFKEGVAKIINGSFSVEAMTNKIGTEASTKYKAMIERIKSPANSPATIRKVLKVIRKFSDDVTVYLENPEIEFDDLGNPIQDKIEKTVKMAVLTPKHNSSFPQSIDGSFLSNKKEGYYILNDTDSFKISENMKIKHNGVIYRIVNIEENYGEFLRMELNIDDKRN